jgi:hypothetical protein
MSTVAENVAAGAAFLDEHDPDWWRENVPNAVNLDTLDIGSGRLCLLAQRCPEETPYPYDTQFTRLTGRDAYEGYTWAVEHGFNLRGYLLSEANSASLTAAWRDLITERRTAAKEGTS